MGLGINLAEQGLVPDPAMKYFIRRLLKQRLREIRVPDGVDQNRDFAGKLENCRIAEHTGKANDQHYEVPAGFFQLVLGKHMKYSSCFYEGGARTLDEAEEAMLTLYQKRAGIENGDSVLDLGCGWGSFSLWIAQRCPDSQVTAVSNSRQQGHYITEEACKRGIRNLEVITADMNSFEAGQRFDRIVSVEMFEHMRNYSDLLNKIATWMNSDGILFIHVFSHRKYPYFFETEGDDNWMGRYFFTGGHMPAHGLYDQYAHILKTERRWFINGKNYGKTAMHWLRNLDANREAVEKIFVETYGSRNEAKIWFGRWRLFFLSCTALFNFNQGREWDVAHFRFVKP